jgi:hypothetical protein
MRRASAGGRGCQVQSVTTAIQQAKLPEVSGLPSQ